MIVLLCINSMRLVSRRLFKLSDIKVNQEHGGVQETGLLVQIICGQYIEVFPPKGSSGNTFQGLDGTCSCIAF